MAPASVVGVGAARPNVSSNVSREGTLLRAGLERLGGSAGGVVGETA